MGTKERPLKGPQDKRTNKTVISWTTFSIGMNFALVAMMLVQQPPSPALGWFFSKATHAVSRALPQPEHRLKETNGSTSAACHNNLQSPAQDRHEQQLLCVRRPGTPRLSSTASDHVQGCLGNGHFVVADDKDDRKGVTAAGACSCHACFSGVHCGDLDPDCLLNLFHGDPTLFEEYWLAQAATEGATVIPSWQGMSYFAHRHNSFLFVDYFLEQAIRSIHALVGNAVTEGRFVLLGVGSTQLFQAALYALASPVSTSQATTSVVSATPHYSSFEGVTKFLDSKRYKWFGDAEKFRRESNLDDEPYIELVTSPNNPCGSMNTAVVNGRNGHVVNDLAYYWPHYTPITAPADYPIMLWTLSKISGHAGTRLGWAIVKDAAVAAKMAYFIQLNTLGVSHDAQQRGITLLRTIMSSYDHLHSQPPPPSTSASAGVRGENEPANRNPLQPFFHHSQAVLEDRWRRMRQALQNSSRFVLPEYDSSECSFLGKAFRANPAFLWLRCKADEDCDQLLRDHRIVARGGPAFGVSSQFVRVSMLDRHPLFDLLLARLASLK